MKRITRKEAEERGYLILNGSEKYLIAVDIDNSSKGVLCLYQLYTPLEEHLLDIIRQKDRSLEIIKNKVCNDHLTKWGDIKGWIADECAMALALKPEE
jgi:hypothetical protein